MPYLKVNDIVLHYIDTGNGFPIVLLHGNGSSLKMYDSEIKYFSKNHRVIAFDMPGHGKSAVPEQLNIDNFWENCGKTIYSALYSLNINQFIIIGVGGGTIAGLYLGIEAKEKVLGIFGDSFEGNTLTLERANEIVSQRDQLQRYIFFKLFNSYLHGSNWKSILKADSDRMLYFAKHRGTFFTETIPIYCPVILSCSAKDEIIPGIVQKMNDLTKLIPNSQTVVFEGGKHPSCLSNKKTYRVMVMEFIRNLTKIND